MAQNHQINGIVPGPQNQLLGGDGVENNGIEPQELERQIVGPGNDGYELILPDYKADIPKKIENSEYNTQLGVQPKEIHRLQQYDGALQRALLDAIRVPDY